jgi:hypothetical protein
MQHTILYHGAFTAIRTPNPKAPFPRRVRVRRDHHPGHVPGAVWTGVVLPSRLARAVVLQIVPFHVPDASDLRSPQQHLGSRWVHTASVTRGSWRGASGHNGTTEPQLGVPTRPRPRPAERGRMELAARPPCVPPWVTDLHVQARPAGGPRPSSGPADDTTAYPSDSSVLELPKRRALGVEKW